MTIPFRIAPNKGFDYINTGNPTTSINPPCTPVTWLNATTGILFICTDNTPGANVWLAYPPLITTSVERTQSQSIPNVTLTAISWANVIALTKTGPLTFWDISDPTRFTIPAGVQFVQIVSGIQFEGTSTVGQRMARVAKNGQPIRAVGQTRADGEEGETTIQTISAPLPVVAGDYFELQAYQNSGGALNVLHYYTFMSIQVLG